MNKSIQFENFLTVFGDFYDTEESAFNDYYSDDSFSILASAGRSFKNVGQKVATGAANAMSSRTKAALTGAAIGAGINYMRGGSIFKGAIGGAGMGLAARGLYNSYVPGGIKGNVGNGFAATSSKTTTRLGLTQEQSNARINSIRERAEARRQARMQGSTAPPRTDNLTHPTPAGVQTEMVFPE